MLQRVPCRAPGQPDRLAGACGLLQRGQHGGAPERWRAGGGGRGGGRVHPDARRPAPGLAGEGAPRPGARCHASQNLVQEVSSTSLKRDGGLSIQHVRIRS